MTITRFCIEIADKEGKKKQVNIAQIREIVNVIDMLTRGVLYKVIRLL